jgi:hypothetical protein
MYFIYNRDDPESKNVENFMDYVYNSHCQCKETCYLPPVSPRMFKKTNNCNSITLPDSYVEDYDKSTQSIIEMFTELNFVTIIDSKFYLASKDKMSWENIKNLQDEQARMLFWLFRKSIVDNIIKNGLRMLFEKNRNAYIQVYSVGSTKLSSDYDITLYGEPEYKIYMIDYFNNEISRLFRDSSDSLFDTNLYGTSFIDFKDIPSKESQSHECIGAKFNYLLDTKNTRDSQLTWALVKYYQALLYIFKHRTKDVWLEIVSGIQIRDHMIDAMLIHDYLTNQNITYTNVILKGVGYMSQEDAISMSNFYAKESYYSKGSFMNVVVNQQICKNNDIVPINIHSLIQSFIENMSFFIDHGSLKYLSRSISVLKSIDDNGELDVNDVIDEFEKLRETHQTTTMGEKIYFTTLSYINDSISLVNTVLGRYLIDTRFDSVYIPFYELFVKTKSFMFKDEIQNRISIYSRNSIVQSPSLTGFRR